MARITTDREARANHIWSWLFRYSVDELERAYKAARESSDRDLARIKRECEELERDVAAGRKSIVETDEEGQVVFDPGEHAGEMIAEIEGVLRILREAFTISLHQLWERELKRMMRLKKKDKYEHKKAFAVLKLKGFTPDEVRLRALQLAANVAKHSEGPSADELCQLRPELFDTGAMKRYADLPGYEHLKITDQVLEEFFEAVRSSGPRRRGR